MASLIFDRVISFDSFDQWTPEAGAFDDFISSTWTDKQCHAELEAAGAGQVISVFPRGATRCSAAGG